MIENHHVRFERPGELKVADAFTFHNSVRINLLKSSKPKREKAIDSAFQDGMMAAYQDVLNMLDGRGL